MCRLLAGLYAMLTTIVRYFNHDRNITTILCPMKSFIKAVQWTFTSTSLSFGTLSLSLLNSFLTERITLNGGPGGLEGRVSKTKTWICSGLAGCTKGRAGGLHISVELHNRAGRRAALKGGPAGCTTERPAGCTKGRAAQQSGRRTALKSGPTDCIKGRAGGLQKTARCRTGRAEHIYVPAGCRKGRAVR